MGFTPKVTQLVTGDQGIDSVDELRNLDDDKASNLCRVLRRPGGTNAAGAVVTEIFTPGVDNADYRAAHELLTPHAHLLGTLAVRKATHIIGCEPALAAQFG